MRSSGSARSAVRVQARTACGSSTPASTGPPSPCELDAHAPVAYLDGASIVEAPDGCVR